MKGRAVANSERTVRIRHDIDRSGNGDDAPDTLGKFAREPSSGFDIGFADDILRVDIDPFRSARGTRKGFHLAHIAAYQSNRQGLKKRPRNLGTKPGGPRSYRIENDRMAELGSLRPRHLHGFDASLVQGSDVDDERIANGRNILDVGRFVAHDGASAYGEHRISAAFHRDIVRDAVDKRSGRTHRIARGGYDVVDFRQRHCHVFSPFAGITQTGSSGRGESAPSQPA